MATFTIALKDVLRIEGDKGNGFRIGLDAYPIFDEEYRDGLNRKIIEQYWNREIGVETISLFTFSLTRKMNQIMPLYNQVYESTRLKFDPISTFDLKTLRADTTEESGTQHAQNNSTNSGNSASRQTNLDTPQTELQDNEDYASSGSVSRSDSVGAAGSISDGTTANKGKVDGTSTTTGYQGSPSDLLLKYRATLINVDMMVINELGELFMTIWDNGEEMLPRGAFYELRGF